MEHEGHVLVRELHEVVLEREDDALTAPAGARDPREEGRRRVFGVFFTRVFFLKGVKSFT